MELQRIFAQGSVDALRFLKRGASLVDAVVTIKLHGGATSMNGVRLTPELVMALAGDVNIADTRITIDDADVEAAWARSTEPMLLRTPRYEGALPDLSLASYQGSVTLVFSNDAGEAQLAFGRAQANATHDAPAVPGSMGAPLFDDAWRVIGLHRSSDGQGVCAYLPIAGLVRALEESPCWDEIAAVHRLARTVAAESAPATEQAAPVLERAVRWTIEGDGAPMPERERRRAIAGKTLADLVRARGNAPGTTPEQRAVDRILAGPPYGLDSVGDDILLPFATAARWFRDVAPGLPDDASLEREVSRRRQTGALVAIVGAHFAPRDAEDARLRAWLSDRDRPPLVIRGPGGIGKSALLAHFLLDNAKSIRFAWIDFDHPDVSADEASIARVVDRHLAWQAPAGTLVVVLDSFETAVQTYGYTNLNPALDALARRFDDLAVVVGSRAPVPLLKVQGEPAQAWELPGLPLDVVTQWLVAEGVAPDLADDVAAVTNGVPLNMKLARDLLKGKSDSDAREIVDALPKELVTGYLYRRILRRLRDDTLKEHAQWAMVPRRLVPELLAAILHVPQEEADRLFAALRSELTLLEGDAVLTVRPDLRNTLLPFLEADDAARVREIDTVAAGFWAQRAADNDAAAEAIYHALRIEDVASAQQLWRSGVARHLGGYAMEELPPASQAWLEARLSRESADTATEALVAGGQVLKAAATLRAQPQGVGTLSGRKRARAVQSLAAESNVEASPAADAQDTLALEAIVLGSSRPAIRIQDGTFALESAPWKHLEGQREALERAVAATGRVQVGDGVVLGSAARVGPRLFITTRTIAEQFAVGRGLDVRLIDGRKPVVDMRAEGGSATDVHAITRAVMIHPYWDIAIVEADMADPGPTLALATDEPAEGIDIAVVGHPVRNEQETVLLTKLFYDAFDVKRLMPGKYVGQQPELSFGRTVSAGRDNATSLSADVGAPVIDVMSGNLVGVRFSWVFLDNAKFVPAWELARDAEVTKAGVAVSGTPLPPPPWASAWSTAAPARSMLLDAYVARTSGDLERARALLEVVAKDDGVKIDRTLLQAACAMQSDSMLAADILQALVEETPRDAWPAADRDAAIATRLRLAVDAEAEREFLEILHEVPMAAGLLEPRHFRVIVPPTGNLPWNRMTDRASPSVFGGDGKLPIEANHAAKRIVDASNRCLSLRGWIESYAKDLANLGYIADRPAPAVREIAAAYVAFPFEEIRPVTDFLLDKTDLAPHPVEGWTPLVKPLFMMFRDARGYLPDGVSSEKDFASWLDAYAKSGRLGTYLRELLRFDVPIAWQAGLLHLTTELPIESLLKRRFSGEKAS